MLKWLIYFIGNMLAMVICYITNPIVVLFADEEGELHGFWHYWQTWDDSLDSMYMMKNVVPNKWYKDYLDYNWDSKYESYQDTETLKDIQQVIEKVRLKPNATFTFKERLQRYCCRVLWLTRNCGYGFAFYVFSASGNIEDLNIVYNKNEEEKLAYEKDKSIFTRNFTHKFYIRIVNDVYLAGYWGWKIPIWHSSGKYTAMIANRIALGFKPPGI